MSIQQMTYSGSGKPAVCHGKGRKSRFGLTWQQKILEKERGKIGAPVQSGFPVDGERLLPNCPLTGISKFGDGLVSKTLELQKCHVALRGSQLPPLELAVDGFTKSPENGVGFAIPPGGVLVRSSCLCPRRFQLFMKLLRPATRGGHLPPVQSNACERGDEDQELEDLQGGRDALPEFDGEVSRHQAGNQHKEDERSAAAGDLRPLHVKVGGLDGCSLLEAGFYSGHPPRVVP